MTVQEMLYDFDLKIDKVASLSNPDFNLAEKEWLLNEGQKVVVKSRYGINNGTNTGFEGNQKRIDDLKNLIVKFPEQPDLDLTDHTGVWELKLSDLRYSYWFFVAGLVQTNSNGCSTWASMKLIQHDDLSEALMDPFNTSDKDYVLFNFGRSSDGSQGSIYLYPNTDLGKIRLTYIKQPSRFTIGGYRYIDGVIHPAQQCELSEHIHSEIVDKAVQIAAGIVQHPQYVQLKAQKYFEAE